MLMKVETVGALPGLLVSLSPIVRPPHHPQPWHGLSSMASTSELGSLGQHQAPSLLNNMPVTMKAQLRSF